MKAIFDKLEITRIQFQDGDNEVEMNCRVTQGNNTIESTLMITFTDLNRILSRIHNFNISSDFSLFTEVPMGNNEMLYECNSRKFGFDSFLLEGLYFQQPIRQIRA